MPLLARRARNFSMDRIHQALTLLGLDTTASAAEIDQAYRDLAMVWHPDRFPAGSKLQAKAAQKLKEINAAYDFLKQSNYERREPGSETSATHDTCAQAYPKQTNRQRNPEKSTRLSALRLIADLFQGRKSIIAYGVAGTIFILLIVNALTTNRESRAQKSIAGSAEVNAESGKFVEEIPSAAHKSTHTNETSTQSKLPKVKSYPLPAVTTRKPSQGINLSELFNQHWIERVKLFREENKKLTTRDNAILVGDSITEGFSVPKYLPGRHVLNRGIAADIIGDVLPESDHRGILRRMDESIFDCRPAHVFLLIGINDLGMGHKPETIETGYRKILEEVKNGAPDVRVHIQSVLPTRGKFGKHNPNVNELNNRLQKCAKDFRYDYVDLHSKMIDDNGELKEEFTGDGLHLKDPGYQMWKSEIERILNW
jgi:lysophospholipase L1-like esterase